MKFSIFFISLFFINFYGFSQNIGINASGSTPHQSAGLDVDFSNKGFLAPRLTTVQRNAISNPANGLIIFNIDTGCPNYYYGLWYSWCGVPICGDSSSNSITFTYRGNTVTYGIVTGANGRCWLDRNLGASQVATSSTDPAAYGDLFQWGRGDDGHQTRTPSPSTTSTLSTTDNPGHGNFILSPSTPDWRNPQNDALWQGVNGINNPCPNGWRLPTQAEWNTERLSWSTNNSAGAFNSPLKLPLTGYRHRSDGVIYDLSSLGSYWSSTSVGGSRSGTMDFYINAANVDSGNRAGGFCVRCIKD
jgi:uncharacterized protein (TIGR02145 family)